MMTELTEEEMQEIADYYGLYTQIDIDNSTNELKAQIKDLCESLDIMNNRENELLEQIEKMKCCSNCFYNECCYREHNGVDVCNRWKMID